MELNRAQQILDCFFVNDKVADVHINNKGLINQTFIIYVFSQQTPRWVLQSVNTQVFNKFEQGLENILKVKGWLENSKFLYNFPTPLEGKYVDFEGAVWRLFPFVENSRCFKTVQSLEQVWAASQCLGSFYQSLDKTPVEELHITLPDFHNGSFRLQQLKEAISSSNKHRLGQAKNLISSVYKEQKVLIYFDDLNNILPKRVVHFDAKISNFLFEQNTNNVKAIIDLDTLMPGTVLSDVGDMIRTYSNLLGEDHKEVKKIYADQKIIKSIITGFLSKADLSDLEKENLYFSGKALSLMQCVRFLTDYLNSDSYYNVTYLDQNLIRSENQWRLYCSLKEEGQSNHYLI